MKWLASVKSDLTTLPCKVSPYISFDAGGIHFRAAQPRAPFIATAAEASPTPPQAFGSYVPMRH